MPKTTAVSILTDSWESVQPAIRILSSYSTWCFNPHRLLGVGATYCSKGSLLSPTLFQSSPTPGSRCNDRVQADNGGRGVVSILTDSWESVQQAVTLGDAGEEQEFQSSPTPGSRCNGRRDGQGHWVRHVSILTDSWESVQHPSWPSRHQGSGSFNPHRLLGVGATEPAHGVEHLGVVSILTDSWESVQHCRAGIIGARHSVSILTDSWESVQPAPKSSEHPSAGRFQSSPTPGSRCNELVG